ncbi:MAG: GGDEF domain-containing protein [Acidobacteriota bacterium]
MSESSGFSWSRLVSELSDGDGHAIQSAGAIVKVRAGDDVFHEGEESDRMYVVLRGEIELIFGGVRRGKIVKDGDILGELSLLLGRRRRSATARAVSDLRLLVLDQSALDSLLKDNPKLLVGMLRNVATYLVESESQLIEDLQKKCAELDQSLDFLRRTQRDLELQELLAETDELTGLYNRRCLNNEMPHLLRRASQEGCALAFLMLDLDDLKGINDRHGHLCGDGVLKHVARLIKDAVRRSDLPCRIGGDEFVVVLTGLAPEDARRRASEIQACIEGTSFDWQAGALTVSVSIGATTYGPGDSAVSLMERADRRLYAAKAAGRRSISWDDGPPRQPLSLPPPMT